MAGTKIRNFIMIDGAFIAAAGLLREAQSYVNNVQQTPITNNEVVAVGLGILVVGLGITAIEKLLRK